MGVLNKDENKSEDMLAILEEMVCYVQSSTLFFGDELTVERIGSVLEDMRRGRTPEERLEGFIAVLSDFHAFGNFLEVSCSFIEIILIIVCLRLNYIQIFLRGLSKVKFLMLF